MKIVLWVLVIVFVCVFTLTWIFEGPCISEVFPVTVSMASSSLCLTSTPDRLRDPWIWNNILNMRSLQGHGGVILSLPWTFAKTGETYVLPMDADEIDGLRILRCSDEGPGTKLLAPLKDPSIPDDRIIMCCDDDMLYKPQTFLHLVRAIYEDPTSVHTLCQEKINGYIGFGAYKHTFLPLLQIPIPIECHTVDDNFFTAVLGSLGIPIRRTPIPGCMSLCQTCSYDLSTATSRILKDRGSLFYKEVLMSNERPKAVAKCIDAVHKNSV